MALLFRQEGYDLILREDIGAVPPQFTKGTLVSVELTDDTFVYSDKLMLLFVPDDGRRKRAPAIIELHKTTTDDLMYYSGTISRAAMMHDGPVLVALAGMTETDTITSNAYPMIVGKSIDPEEGLLAEPATLSEVIDGSVDAWIAAN
ncbi:MAG: hypothetical protein LUE11_12910, partial [Clostridia bacterium]|nr:hypothetical protein [Clostridia bacterium]